MNAPDAPSAPSPRRSFSRRLLTVFGISAPIGGVVGYFVGRALKQSGATLPDLSVADVASVIIGIVLLFSAAYAYVATTSPARWNRMVEKQPDDESVDPDALRSGRWQALVAALAGIMIMTPPLAMLNGFGTQTLGAIAVGLFVLLAVQSWINWKLWREGDELTRAVIAQTGAVCFWVLQLGLFAWATITKLKFASDTDSWSLMTVLMGAYLIVSVVISTRRGLVNV
ncbi:MULTISPECIES: hypothetical protein [unclassified Sphingomonas]|uniref:hypothetical protein n=1 Tax=unclassified Sphingomonas TaxID=196159 RepID=UPI000BD91B1F|nr:MAG: hypothetical protein B7Z43_02025 [Sphingomonas sp. 12-62-6]OYX39396.1 MAG: hypothetical protein B7Y98_05600 [Sphingomonas sp. 32-62-10]